uniref:SAP domain-containing protein n=1 Tax=viral metagenome TaxID=1070528 RepID=A0A6C0I167_9ZZZZ
MKKIIIDPDITYSEFYKNNTCLKKINLKILKKIAKKNKLHCSGNKPIITERIETFFYKHKMANIIQKYFRGYLVRLLYKKREPVKNCVNETDFYTMEPLSEINQPFLYIYKEDEKISYGFHLSSVYALIYSSLNNNVTKEFVKNEKNIVKNPYNRSNMPTEIINDVNKLYRISCIIHKNANGNGNGNAKSKKNENNLEINNEIVNIRRTRRRSLTNDFYPTPTMEIYQERVRKLNEIREKPMQNRVSELFTEMDYLGNYTCEEWFYEIRSAENYLRLYRTLFNIWYHRSQMPLDIRQKICMCGDPFENIVAFSASITRDNIQENCLRVFENMIFMGVDDEHRKLGAFHALSALTVVSIGARDTMPWLYESLMVL